MSNDPLQALQAALAVPADSEAQASLLANLRENLEAHPTPIPILCSTLIKAVSGAGDSLLKRWVLDLVHYALGRSTLSFDAKTQRQFIHDVHSNVISDHEPNYSRSSIIRC